jgi:hypothetical protein
MQPRSSEAPNAGSLTSSTPSWPASPNSLSVPHVSGPGAIARGKLFAHSHRATPHTVGSAIEAEPAMAAHKSVRSRRGHEDHLVCHD